MNGMGGGRTVTGGLKKNTLGRIKKEKEKKRKKKTLTKGSLQSYNLHNRFALLLYELGTIRRVLKQHQEKTKSFYAEILLRERPSSSQRYIVRV